MSVRSLPIRTDAFSALSSARGHWLALCACTLALTGCDTAGPSVAQVNGKAVSEAQFAQYLALKRIDSEDEKRRNAALDEYLQREALAGVIMQQPTLDEAAIAAEVSEFRKELLINRYFDEYLSDRVSDDAVRNYYTSHAAEYEQEQVKVAHLLIRTDRNNTEAERQARLTTAQDAYGRIYAGQDFAAVVSEFSQDQVSAKKGGELGWLKRGAIDKRFSDVAFGLAPDEVSEPFETPFGFHIVKHLDGPMTTRRPFESVKGDIRYQLRRDAKQAEIERLLGLTEIEVKQ